MCSLFWQWTSKIPFVADRISFEMNACAVCNSPSEKKCSVCQRVYYCSKEHQKQDWKHHKGKCVCFQIEESKELGRHLVASRTINPGEEILREKPLVSGPPQSTPSVCLGCYRVLTALSSLECPKCGWPMCSAACAKSPHHIPECRITVDKGAKVNIQTFQIPHPSYASVIVVRCLFLKKEYPTTWKKLLTLQSHCDERKGSGKYEQERVYIAQFIHRFFKMTDFSEEEILKVVGIINVNGHEVPITGNNFVSIYETASFLEHNCHANCSKSFSSKGELVIRAAKTIPAGAHLSICYTDPLWGAENRRQHLLETKYFECRCERCKDPTEFDTHFNSLRCLSSDCKDFIVPLSSLTPQGESWKCLKCAATSPAELINNIISKASSELALLDRKNVKAHKNFIKEATGILHPNHYLLTSAKLVITELLEEGVSGLSDEDLLLKTTYCRQLIKLTKTLVPAENRCIGVLLFGLHAALAETGRRKSNTGELDSDGLKNNLLECREILAESYRYLKHEPDILPEGQIAQQAKANLKDIEKILLALHVQEGDLLQ